MSAVLAPAPLPAGPGIPAEDGPQPPGRGRLVGLTRLQRQSTIEPDFAPARYIMAVKIYKSSGCPIIRREACM